MRRPSIPRATELALVTCIALVLGVCVTLMLRGSPARAQAAADADALRRLLASTPADSVLEPLRRFEAEHGRLPVAGDAALAAGAFHFARGEYRQAVESYGRAAARLDPDRKAEAHYGAGLAWLGVGDPNQARAAFEEAARENGPFRARAQVGLAQAWEASGHPDRALEILEDLLRGDPGEAGPVALERCAALADGDGRETEARRARERLLRDYPRSIEAASIRLALASAGGAPSERGALAVAIGAFIDPARARALAAEARRAGFPEARVVTRGEGLAAVHAVWVGTYGDRIEARHAGEQAARALGVVYQLERTP